MLSGKRPAQPQRAGSEGLDLHQDLILWQQALIHYAAAFLFQLHKDLIPRLWHAVAADAQLFFIGGLFQRGPDEPEIIGIAVDVADGVFVVAVGGHVLAHFTQHCFRLRGGDKVFLFNALEAVLCSVCHIGHPFRIGWLYLKAAA